MQSVRSTLQYFGFFLVAFFATGFSAFSQKDFTGIVKYKMTVEGDSAKRVDSMAIVFGKNKFKIILFIPDQNNWGIPQEKIFIDDFEAGKTYDVDGENGTYRVTELRNDSSADYRSTGRFDAMKRLLGVWYEANAFKLNKGSMIKAECLGSIDFLKKTIASYTFLGVQPVVVDNRIVMDYIYTQPNGKRPRVYMYDLEKIEDTDAHFDLSAFNEIKP
jgi:hypothetical protein